MRIYIGYLLFIISGIVLIPGCTPGEDVERAHQAILNPDENVDTLPRRIVSMSPNLTEIIYALGADELLIGVDEYSNYPPEANDKSKVGNYLDPDLEALIAIQPDMVLIVDTDEKMQNMLDGLDLDYRNFSNNKIAEILRSIESLGELLGKESEAETLIQNFHSAKETVLEALEGVDPVRVVLVVGRNPGRLQDIYVAGPGNYLSELIEIAGGINVFGNQDVIWPQVGVEALIGADPEIIIDSTLSKGASDPEFIALAEDWLELSSIRAVRDGNIIVPEEGWFQIPGANLDKILMLIAHWIHPEIFPDEVEDPYSESIN